MTYIPNNYVCRQILFWNYTVATGLIFALATPDCHVSKSLFKRTVPAKY